MTLENQRQSKRERRQMGVGCGQNLFKQHRCSRRECVSAALHPVGGSQIRHEWEMFVVGVEGEIKDMGI